MAADELIHVTRWHNGEKTYSPFSDGEMARRRDAMQALSLIHISEPTRRI